MHPYERDKRYYELAEKWKNGTITPREEEEFAQWHLEGQDAPVYLSEDFVANESAHEKRMLDRLRQKAGLEQPNRRISFGWFPYAAAALLVVSVVGWYLSGVRQPAIDNELAIAGADIQPGGNRATLTLADGRTITLDEAQAGIIVGHEDITYADGSVLDVTLGDTESLRDITLLELTTPKGGTYQVTLPDGSDVWLNSASTIRYPNRFEGDERTVEISGEVYFAVTPDKDRPFYVESNGQLVKVLGTEFNISTYPDDPDAKTTLLEGTIEVSNLVSKSSHLLTPGQQATTHAGQTDINEVNTEQYIAWKSGKFLFMRTPFRDMISQVARWYDIEVVYEGEVPRSTFSGDMKRSVSLMTVLDMLRISNIPFRVEGKKLIIE